MATTKRLRLQVVVDGDSQTYLALIAPEARITELKDEISAAISKVHPESNRTSVDKISDTNDSLVPDNCVVSEVFKDRAVVKVTLKEKKKTAKKKKKSSATKSEDHQLLENFEELVDEPNSFPPLPEGWEEVKDGFGIFGAYYIDHNTRTTTRIRPGTELANMIESPIAEEKQSKKRKNTASPAPVEETQSIQTPSSSQPKKKIKLPSLDQDDQPTLESTPSSAASTTTKTKAAAPPSQPPQPLNQSKQSNVNSTGENEHVADTADSNTDSNTDSNLKRKKLKTAQPQVEDAVQDDHVPSPPQQKKLKPEATKVSKPKPAAATASTSKVQNMPSKSQQQANNKDNEHEKPVEKELPSDTIDGDSEDDQGDVNSDAPSSTKASCQLDNSSIPSLNQLSLVIPKPYHNGGSNLGQLFLPSDNKTIIKPKQEQQHQSNTTPSSIPKPKVVVSKPTQSDTSDSDTDSDEEANPKKKNKLSLGLLELTKAAPKVDQSLLPGYSKSSAPVPKAVIAPLLQKVPNKRMTSPVSRSKLRSPVVLAATSSFKQRPASPSHIRRQLSSSEIDLLSKIPITQVLTDNSLWND